MLVLLSPLIKRIVYESKTFTNEMFVIAERPNNLFIIETVFHMVNAG